MTTPQTLSPREIGQALGVSESSVKRWIDEGRIPAARTAGGHRRVALSDAVRYTRREGLPLVKPEILGLADLRAAREAPELAGTDRPLLAALVGGHAAVARGILQARWLGGAPLASICDEDIASAFEEIGEMWLADRGGIFLEHRAVDVCLQALSSLRPLLPPPAGNAPRAVGAGLPHDPYLLPSMCAALVLAGEGWRTTNLGPDTPWDTLRLAAEETGARLVWLSVSAEAPEDLAGRIGELAEALAGQGAYLAVGGRKLPEDLRCEAPNAHATATMRELVAYSRGLRAAEKGAS